MQTAANILFVLAVSGCMLSGILASRRIFSLGNGSTIEFGRFLHIITTARAFILISVYLGLHWPGIHGDGKENPHEFQSQNGFMRSFLAKTQGILLVLSTLFMLNQF